ncbi:hypothetical protein Q428_14825 [Fervidicella metallireducens AeB]|uniref:Uncharacterized protein n=1 Tax=Fervidicella metallireducens AeB TaxID=1403537 RepID=A0A017RRA5_9CLOT|nr:hypothetical protein Q428_14825 [Fervidicella metallireducens AeB]
MVQVKAPGSLSFPGTNHISAMRAEWHAGIWVGFSAFGSASGSCSEENHTYRRKRKSKAGSQPELDYVNTFESTKKGHISRKLCDHPLNNYNSLNSCIIFSRTVWSVEYLNFIK